MVMRLRRHRPWITSPDRIHEVLPGRTGAFLSAVGWLFCRDATLLIFAFTFAFLLSIFPLIVLLISVTGQLPLDGFRDTLFRALEYFFPISQEWIVRNLGLYIQEVGMYQAVSLVLLAWAGSALFFALEAALESAYRVELPRNFVGSQVRGTVLVLALGVLALLATAVLHWTVLLAVYVLPAGFPESVIFLLSYYFLAFVVVLCLMCSAFYVLPNHDVPFRRILPEATFATVLVLGADGVFRWLAPELRLQEVYGPFYVSVTILLWGYTFGCIIVGSARLGANGFFSGQAVRQGA
jgi:membrane protein